MVRLAAQAVPPLRRYRALMKDGDLLYLDLSESMCMGYFFYGELPHEAQLCEFVRRYLPEGGTFVDIGANVGYYTRKASHIVGPKGRVLAFEPAPNALRVLKLNAQDLDNVAVFGIAAGEVRESRTFHLQEAGDTSTLLPASGGRAIAVEVAPLDEVLADAPAVDLIKIDVEGYEMNVLAGARSLLTRHKPIVLFEYIDSYAALAGATFQDIKAFFCRVWGPDHIMCGFRADGDSTGTTEPGRDIHDFAAIPAGRLSRMDLPAFLTHIS